MRRGIVVGIVALGLAAMPLTAEAAARQVVVGRVVVPGGPAATGTCLFSGVLTHWAARAQGAPAYIFEVDSGTWGKPFELRPAQLSDIDITFLGGGNASFMSKSFTGETGVVPFSAKYAAVCLETGLPTGFAYTAG